MSKDMFAESDSEVDMPVKTLILKAVTSLENMDPDKRTPASAKTPAAKGRRMSKSATPAVSRASSAV